MTADRFVHDGRPLASWLLQIVDDSAAERRSANRVIVDRFFMPTELLLLPDANYEQLSEEFNVAVRHAVHQPDFPAIEFVTKLFSLTMALEALRMDEWHARNKEEDAWHDEQRAKLGEKPTTAEVQRYLKRVCVRLRRECEAFNISARRVRRSPGDEAFETVVTFAWIIDALGVELLPAAPLIRHMLNEIHQGYIASKAIGRMGVAAKEFYPDLLSGLERDDLNGEYAEPLGILLRHDKSLVPEIFSLIDSSNAKVRINAVRTLAFCGRETLKQFPEIEAKLREWITRCDKEEWFTYAMAIGEIAITTDSVSLLLEATYSLEEDRVAAAISSLGQIGLEAERIVQRLVELLAVFSEPDTDWSYHGANSRIVDALKGFGAHAHIAIPTLIDRVWMEPEGSYNTKGTLIKRADLDEAVVKFLGSCGEAAKEALPILLAARLEVIKRALEERASEDEDKSEDGPVDEDDFCPDYLIEAIKRIQSDT